MIVDRQDSRKRQHSSNNKARLELPKISRTTLLATHTEKQNNPSYAERVAWVVQTVDYSAYAEVQIDEEYRKLRKQLHAINVEVAKAIEKIDIKAVKKSKLSEPDPARTLEIRDKQVENNCAIIDRLRKEYQQLQKRVSSVTVFSKEDIEQEIGRTKEEIDKIRKKIKELKMKNKDIGDKIMGSDDLLEQIKRLESEREVNQRKKLKLQSKTDTVYDQILSIELKLEQISDNYTVAQNFFEEYYDKSNLSEQQKQLDNKYRHSKHCLQVVQKKNETTLNLRQQKYHIALRNLEAQMAKLNTVEQKTASIQLQIIHCKKLIKQYEERFKNNESMKQSSLIAQEPIFFTELDADHEKNSSREQNNRQSRGHDKLVAERTRSQAKQSIHEQIPVQANDTQQPSSTKIETQAQIKQNPNSIRARERISTSNGVDPEQEQDIMMELDEKFKYQTKHQMRKSRYNDKDTEIGSELVDDIVDEDEEMEEFRSKITEEKTRRNSKDFSKLSVDLSKVKTQLESIEIKRPTKNQPWGSDDQKL